MIRPGLLSVTFRQLSPRQIVDLACEAGLAAIEWGGDIHVPHGDVLQAQTVRAMSDDAGLQLPTYGSYYRAGHGDTGPFELVLETAIALGTPTIRVWAGRFGSDAADKSYRQQVIDDTRDIVDLAAAADVNIAYEFHGNTLTDSYASAVQLLESVGRPALRSLWQPPKGSTQQKNLDGIDHLAPWIQHIHVFSWLLRNGGTVRLPLADHASPWRAYLDRLNGLPSDRYALLEFVRGDDPQQFLADAATLKHWLDRLAI